MYEQLGKPKKYKSRAVANSVTQKKSYGKKIFGFVDNRSEAVEHRKLQSSMHNGIVQKQPLALADRPWQEIEELSATFGREAVLKGKINHVPTRDQVIHSSSLPSHPWLQQKPSSE